MSIGNNTVILICSPGATEAYPCPSGTGPATVSAYVLSPSAAEYVEALGTPFDPSQAIGFWGIAMSAVLTCWFLAFVSKQIIKAVN
jgi:hypothetical protein